MIDTLLSVSAMAVSLAAWIGLAFHGLLEAFWRGRQAADRRPCEHAAPVTADLPVVTIQLPVYNEFYVVERLIESCCALDYPPDRLEIQVLDDSTDETTAVIARKVEEWREKGRDLRHLRRADRSAFKAGNLQHGLASARGEFLAIFDADFVPDGDFLLKTLPHFHEPRVGIVYPRHVRHLNGATSVVTRAQDPVGPAGATRVCEYLTGEHFNFFFGSPGVVRRACLIETGGWLGDTLCEDEDLTIRSYLRGWRCVVLDEFLSSDEVPERIDEVKRQFVRWKKGNAECYRKYVGTIARNRTLTRRRTLTMLAALHAPWLYVPCMALIALASVPLLLVPDPGPFRQAVLVLHSAFAVIWVFGTMLTHNLTSGTNVFLHLGLHPRVSWGIVQGFLGIRTPFFRSPKRNSAAGGGSAGALDRYPVTVTPATFLEGAFALYFVLGLYLAFQRDNLLLVPFHLLCLASFGFVFALSVREALASGWPRRSGSGTGR